jgi:arylsulfatase A-like enzyme
MSRKQTRPNVLVFMCDQLRYDVFSYMNHTVMQTPYLDRLVEEGVLFTDAICTYPLCGPSRAAMLTGCYSYDDKYLPKNREPEWSGVIPADVVTVDEVLANAGYHVEYHGKWHVGDCHRDCYRGDREVFGHKIGVYHDYLAARYEPPTGEEYAIERYTKWPYNRWPVDHIVDAAASKIYNIYNKNHFGVMEVRDDDTLTAFTVRKTIDFLRSRPPEPFAVTCSILHPHLPYTPNQTYADMYDPAEMPAPKNIYSYYYPPLTLQPGKKPPIPELLPEGKEGLGQCQALYYALVKEIDDWFGRIMSELEQGGYREDTLVIFTSDHGHLLGSHNMLEKFQFFEESIRIPLIMSYPAGMPAGARPIAPATGADIAPTILDYCDIDQLPQFHGHSLRYAAETPATTGSRSDPWAFAETQNYSCFRSHQWKVVYDPEKKPEMVFNLEEDPGEFINLIEGSPDARALRIAEELQNRIPPTTNSYWKSR